MRAWTQNHLAVSGFTLLEVMVALAIMALAVSSIMGIFSTALAGITKSDLHSEGILIARNVLEEHLLKPDLKEGEYSGSKMDLFNWSVLVVPRSFVTQEGEALSDGEPLSIDWIQEKSALQMYELVVTVSWPNAAYPGSVTFTTLQARIDTDSEQEEEPAK